MYSNKRCRKNFLDQIFTSTLWHSYFDMRNGMLIVDFLEKCKTFCDRALLPELNHLKEDISKNRSYMQKKASDISPRQSVQVFCTNYASAHPPCSSDLVPSDFYLLTNLKKKSHLESIKIINQIYKTHRDFNNNPIIKSKK